MNRLKGAYSSCMNCGGKVKMKSGGNWIKKAVSKNPGSFTAQANNAGMSVPAFRNKVLSNKSDYSSTTVKRANLAKTLSGMRKGEDGMLSGSDKRLSKSDKRVLKVIDYSSAVKPRGLFTSETSMGMPTTPTAIDSPTNWYNESTGDKAQAENAARPVANTPVSSSNPTPKTEGSPKVKAYQEMLRSKGYNIAADGAWGPQTQKAYESYIKSKTTAVTSPAKTAPAKTSQPGVSSQIKYTASQWDKAMAENNARPAAGATYGPTKTNMMKPAPKAAYVAPRAPIAAPGKTTTTTTKKPDTMAAWAQKVVAQNTKKK